MSHFHLSAELPGGDENREKRVEIMAEGLKTALTYGATNPEIRLRMLMGEAFAKWTDLLKWFREELSKESPEVQELANRSIAGDSPLLLGRGDKVLDAQLRFLS